MKTSLQSGFLGRVALLSLLATTLQASTVLVGTFSFDTFIPAAAGSPGVNAFNVGNLTGSFGLPPDFPVADDLTFGSASLKLTLSDLSQVIIALGDIGPGFLVDSFGNPVAQVAGDQSFISAELTATLTPLTFTLADTSLFTANSSVLDVVLLPSNGIALVADTDQTLITVSSATTAAVPEPASILVTSSALLFALGLGGMKCRRGQNKNE